MKNKLTIVRAGSACPLLAGIALALALTFGCTSSDDVSGSGGSQSSMGGGNPSGSSSSRGGGNPSGPSSSSSNRCGGDSDVNEGSDKGNDMANYKTVTIGDQVWMAENLNYNVDGSKCAGNDCNLYDKNTINCDKYGRLYDWATAMALPSKCNDLSFTSDADCAVKTSHQGICPSGWHVSNNVDWNVLMNFIDQSCYEGNGCGKVGIKLKATSGWDGYDENSHNGTDDYGFAALPGGQGYGSRIYGYSLGKYGYWWSSSADRWLNESQAYYNYITGTYDFLGWKKSDSKDFNLSVRCVKNDENGVRGGKGNDISNYRTVQIGTQTWMAENLNYAVEGSKCRDDEYRRLRDRNTAACDTYGRLYDWATAMDLPPRCNNSSCLSQITAKHRGLCPAGWHIPSDADWNVLMKFVNPNCYDNADCPDAGTKLKATSGWPDYSYDWSSGNGTDDYGFSALPGGNGSSYDGSFSDGNGSWWSSSEAGSSYAHFRRMFSYGSVIRNGNNSDEKDDLYSVRCLKD